MADWGKGLQTQRPDVACLPSLCCRQLASPQETGQTECRIRLREVMGGTTYRHFVKKSLGPHLLGAKCLPVD